MSKSLKIQKKRRRQNRTDYKARLVLLKSGRPRIAIRRTNKFVIMQVIESKESQDKILLGVSSKDLLDNGWDKKYVGSLKSIPAAYLTGLLMASKLDKKQNYIIDMGMARNIHGSRIYASINGLVDGGVNLKVNKEVFPSEDRLNGEHMEDDVKKMIAKVKEKLQ